MGLQLEVSVPRWHPLFRPDDFVRNCDGGIGGSGFSGYTTAEPWKNRGVSGPERMAGIAPPSRRCCGGIDRPMSGLFVFGVSCCSICGDEPASVRLARGGNRIGRRISHRILGHAFCPLFPRGICGYDIGLGHHGDSIPRWMESSVALVERATHATIRFWMGAACLVGGAGDAVVVRFCFCWGVFGENPGFYRFLYCDSLDDPSL